MEPIERGNSTFTRLACSVGLALLAHSLYRIWISPTSPYRMPWLTLSGFLGMVGTLIIWYLLIPVFFGASLHAIMLARASLSMERIRAFRYIAEGLIAYMFIVFSVLLFDYLEAGFLSFSGIGWLVALGVLGYASYILTLLVVNCVVRTVLLPRRMGHASHPD